MVIKTTTGKLSVWLVDDPIENKALRICTDLAAGGERLLVLDAAGCLDPSRLSRIEASVAKNIHVLRISRSDEFPAAFWEDLKHTQVRTQTRRILLAGILDNLCSCRMLTRDTARALGRIKMALEELVDSGLEINVLCQSDSWPGSGPSGPGTKTYLIASLCAAADEVRHLTAVSQHVA